MKTAILADIHGNLPALETCVMDALEYGVEAFVFLGDYVSDFASPRETMELLYALKGKHSCWFVRGNREGYMLDCWAGKRQFHSGSKEGSLAFTYRNLRDNDLQFFAGLPIYQKAEIGGLLVELAHAEKDTDRHVFEPGDPYLSRVFQNMETNCLLTAHSHCQYIAHEGEKVIVNPGAVGYSGKVPGTACYALGEFSPVGTSFILRQVPYDVSRTIEMQFSSNLMEDARFWALGVLNNLITGEDCILQLLQAVRRRNGEDQEEVWEQEAKRLNLALTWEELLSRWQENVTSSLANS